MDPKTLLQDKVHIDVTETNENGEEIIVSRAFDYGFLAMHSSASMTELTIKSISAYGDDGKSGEMSILCEARDGTEIVVRTEVLRDAEGKTITADAFPIGSVIDVYGVIDVFRGVYQIKVFSESDIVIVH
jgi:hypothetical protein